MGFLRSKHVDFGQRSESESDRKHCVLVSIEERATEKWGCFYFDSCCAFSSRCFCAGDSSLKAPLSENMMRRGTWRYGNGAIGHGGEIIQLTVHVM